MQAVGGQYLDHAGGDHGGQALDRVEPGRGKRPVGGHDAAGRQHQQRQHRHRLPENLQQLQHVELVPDPRRGQLRATDTREGQHAQANPQHPAAIHPAQVAQGRYQRQGDQLWQGHDQHYRRGLQRPIALHLRQVTGRQDDHRLQHHQHPGQHDQGKRQVAQAEHLQLEERHRV